MKTGEPTRRSDASVCEGNRSRAHLAYAGVVTIRSRSEKPTLAVGGLVAHPRTWSWDELAAHPQRIPNLGELAEGFVGEAVPLAHVLTDAGPEPAATHATVFSDDGHYRASIPIGDLVDLGWLAVSLDGEPLPRDEGGPLRVVVPRGRTLCWNVKSAVEIRVTAGPEPDSVPENPPH